MVARKMNKMRAGRPRARPQAPKQQPRRKPGRSLATAQSASRLSLSAPAARYLAALTHPFSKQAEGARVPEPYAINTVTRKIHQPIVLTTNAGGGFDLSVQPHLLASYVCFSGTISGGAGTWVPNNTPAGVSMRSAVTGSALAALALNYRIVAFGVRIKPNLDFTKAGGRVYGAVLPASVELPNGFDVGTTLTNVAACFAIPFDSTANAISTNIVNMPRGFQFTTSELMAEGGAEIVFPICGAAATTFLEANSGQTEQGTSIAIAGGAMSDSAPLGYMTAAGFSQLVLRGEGLQASADVFTIEVIYHVEGTPNVTGGSTLVESMPHNNAPASPMEVHLVHASLARMAVVDYVKRKTGDVAGRLVNAGINRAGRAAAGAAERVLGLGMRALML